MIYKRSIAEKIKIKELFSKLNIEDKEHATMSIPFPLGVKTPYGYKNIVTAFRTEKQETVTTYFKNNKTLKTSNEHLLKVNGDWKKIKDIVESDIVETEFGNTSIKRKHIGKEEILYDISVEEVHCYFSNGIVSHNSWLLTRLGAEAMKQGKNVLHVTLELNETYVGLRYDAYLSGISFQSVRNNIPVIQEKIDQHRNNGGGELYIKYFPLKTVSPHSLKMYIERLEMITGKKIEVLVVDYADILRSQNSDRNSNSYSESGGVYEELRQIAGELQIPVWSASQTNRGGHEEDVIQAHNVADSYRKIMTGDFIISLSRKTEDKVKSTGRIHIIKNRFGQDGDTFPMEFDTSTGNSRLYEMDSLEGKAILERLQEPEQGVHELLRDAWNSHKGDGNAGTDNN